MEFDDSGSSDALPKAKQKNPIMYMVVHLDDKTGEKIIKECENRRDARKYVNHLSNPESVEVIYRISAKIQLKKKITMTW